MLCCVQVNVEYNLLDPLLRSTINPQGDVNDETGEGHCLVCSCVLRTHTQVGMLGARWVSAQAPRNAYKVAVLVTTSALVQACVVAAAVRAPASSSCCTAQCCCCTAVTPHTLNVPGYSPFPGNINQLVIKLSSYVHQLQQTGA